MRWMQYKKAGEILPAIILLLFLTACGSGALLADGGIVGTGAIIGTVPGTVIEAYGEQGQYVRTYSEFNSTGKHPFLLELPAGVGYYLVMIINENTRDEVVMPIAFRGNRGELLARIALRDGDRIDLGHVALYMNCGEVPHEDDPDEDCVLDRPFILDESMGSFNPLLQMDSDDDGIDDYVDEDHGYGHHGSQNFHDPQDHDDDRIPNFYDADFQSGFNDADEDGIDDEEDENPGNIPHDHHD